jgi:hypothetical protein
MKLRYSFISIKIDLIMYEKLCQLSFKIDSYLDTFLKRQGLGKNNDRCFNYFLSERTTAKQLLKVKL